MIMKNIKRTVLGFLTSIFLITSLPSCTDGFESINTDPNRMPVVPPSSLLAPTIYYGHWTLLNYSRSVFGQLMQYSVQTNGFESISQYTIKDSQPTYLWNNLYRRLNDANEMCVLAEDLEDDTSLAVGLTLKAWLMANITDIWGDVPYSEALKANEGQYQPKFDNQEDIYTGILADLERANTIFATSSTTISETSDILYGGSKAKWRKLCNSLRVRYLLRVSSQSSMNSGAKIQEILDNPSKNPIFTSAADGAIISYSGVEPFVNPFYNVKTNEFSGNFRMCSRLVKQMNGTNDPRRSLYMTSIAGEYYGIDSGNDQAYILEAMDNNGLGTSRFHTNLQNKNYQYALMSYSELQFCLAEAAHRGLISGNATQYHENALRATFTEWKSTASATAINAFVTRASVAYDGTLDRIMEQKWISLFFVGYESWNDYRRTGLPQMPMGNALDNQGVLPTRLRYPAILQSINATNWKQAVDNLGGTDSMTSKLWWAKTN